MPHDADLRAYRRRLVRLALFVAALALVVGVIIMISCWSSYCPGLAVTWDETWSQIVMATAGTAAHLVHQPLSAVSIVVGIFLNLFAFFRSSRWLVALLGDALIAGGWIAAVLSLSLDRFA